MMSQRLAPCLSLLTTARATARVRPRSIAPSHALLSGSVRRFSDGDKEASDQHEMFRIQMMEMQEERQALFGFTNDEKSAWSTASVSHSKTLMEAVNEARETVLSNPPPEDDYSWIPHDGDTINDEDHNFTHVSSDGNSVTMVDVGNKKVSQRVARAQSKIVFPPEIMAAFEMTNGDLIGPKGPIFATAKLAGIMAAKRTSDLIPLCHPLPLDKVHVDIRLHGNVATIECECRVTHKTGVEMEALTGATVAALTIYDMVKAVSHRVTIQQTMLISKTGGKRDITPE